jgi:5-bromo-4-chloroindolyl phosphate hydrolysis protein
MTGGYTRGRLQAGTDEPAEMPGMKKNKPPHIALALIIALAAFALSFIVLQWNILIAAFLSLACYLGLSFLVSPVSKLGGVDLGDIKNGKEILELIEEGEKDLASIKTMLDTLQDQHIRTKAQKLCREGGKIVGYIKKNPRKAFMARRFFNYYLSKANEILTKYHAILSVEIETERLAALRGKTLSALDSILRGMVLQFSRLISSDVLDIELDLKLLENVVKMEDA